MEQLTFFDGAWHEGSPAIIGPMTQSFMHGSAVFDGARAFDGLAPDLDRHCARLFTSAEVMGLYPEITADEVLGLAREGAKRFARTDHLYVRPALYSEQGFLLPEPGGTRFVLTLFKSPLPPPSGISICLSRYRRPNPDMAPTDAKASCLYPTSSLAIKAARDRGFDNAIMRDGADNVVELGSANLWLAKDGVAITPAHNRTFLNGITRQRVIKLLRDDGIDVVERAVRMDDLLAADEVFATGNFPKVIPVTRVEDRALQPGPIFARARSLYWDFAASQPL